MNGRFIFSNNSKAMLFIVFINSCYGCANGNPIFIEPPGTNGYRTLKTGLVIPQFSFNLSQNDFSRHTVFIASKLPFFLYQNSTLILKLLQSMGRYIISMFANRQLGLIIMNLITIRLFYESSAHSRPTR